MPTWVKEACEHFNWLTATSPSSTVDSLITAAGWVVSHASSTYSVDGPYSGDRAITQGVNGRWIYKQLSSNYSEIYLNLHIKFNSGFSPFAIQLWDNGSNQVEIGTTGGFLRLSVGATTVASSSNTISTGVWYFLQIKVIINSSSGSIIARMNNSEWVSYSGDTQNTANAYINQILLYCDQFSGAVYFANVAAYTDSGSWPLEECRYIRASPNAAGNYSQFTPLSSTNVSNIDEQQPDDDTTYNSSTTPGNKDSFGTDAALGTNDAILLVFEETWAKKTDAGTRDLRTLLRISGTDYESSSFSLTSAYARYRNDRTVDPSTSNAFTASTINALETGYKDQA